MGGFVRVTSLPVYSMTHYRPKEDDCQFKTIFLISLIFLSLSKGKVLNCQVIKFISHHFLQNLTECCRTFLVLIRVQTKRLLLLLLFHCVTVMFFLHVCIHVCVNAVLVQESCEHFKCCVNHVTLILKNKK